MKNKVVRNSNIELLRLIAIIGIIISHFCVHQVYPDFTLNNINLQSFFCSIFVPWLYWKSYFYNYYRIFFNQ